MLPDGPVISLWNPWAMLWALGEKKNETRHWPLPKRFIGQTVYIHAAQRWTQSERDYCKFLGFREALLRHPEVVGAEAEEQPGVIYRGVHLGSNDYIALPFGAIIGSVKLAGCEPTHDLKGKLLVDVQEIGFGNYQQGRFAWIGEDHKVIKPFVPLVGHQGFFNYKTEADFRYGNREDRMIGKDFAAIGGRSDGR